MVTFMDPRPPRLLLHDMNYEYGYKSVGVVR